MASSISAGYSGKVSEYVAAEPKAEELDKTYGLANPELKAVFSFSDAKKPEHKTVLDLFGATRFIPTEDTNYSQIEAVGKQIGMIVNSAR